MSEKYKIDKDKKTDEIHEKAIEKLEELRKLDEQNPMEQAEKYDAVKKNPPEHNFMKVDLFAKTTLDGEPYVESRSKDIETGESQSMRHNPFFTIDLNTAIMANVAACPSNVIPMLIDQSQRLAVDKMKTFKAEKREKEFNWWWVLFILLLVAPLFPIILYFL